MSRLDSNWTDSGGRLFFNIYIYFRGKSHTTRRMTTFPVAISGFMSGWHTHASVFSRSWRCSSSNGDRR